MRVRARTESANGNRPVRTSTRRTSRGWRHALWTALATPGQRLLMFDYDGTLAPFRVNRAHAVLPSSTRRSLRRLASLSDHTLVIVSGRSLSELARLVGGLPIHLVGEHGWEEREPGGRIRRAPMRAAPAIALASAAARAEELGLVDHLERKRTAVVLHVRGMHASDARGALRSVTRAWKPLARSGGLRLDEIVGGLELRAIGHDKGEVVRRLLAMRPRPGLAVYIGDDTTDEDAFAAVRSRGVGVRVGVRHRVTRATGTLASPADVSRFLGEWWERALRTARESSAAPA